jgi:trimeric autotransporter adhesin
MKLPVLFLLLVTTMLCNTITDQVSLNTSGTPPVANAMLDITSTSKGILIPRMTSGERDLILDPAVSLMIYNTTTNTYNYWNGTAW